MHLFNISTKVVIPKKWQNYKNFLKNNNQKNFKNKHILLFMFPKMCINLGLEYQFQTIWNKNRSKVILHFITISQSIPHYPLIILNRAIISQCLKWTLLSVQIKVLIILKWNLQPKDSIRSRLQTAYQ